MNIQTRQIVGNVQQTIQAFIDQFEGFKPLAYWDTSSNPQPQPTIGLGVNLNVPDYLTLVVQEIYGTSVNSLGFYNVFRSGLKSIRPTIYEGKGTCERTVA